MLSDEIGTILNPTSDTQLVLATVVGEEIARKVCEGFRRVRLRDLVGGVELEPEAIHEPNSPQERRAAALVCMILEKVSQWGRAWTDELFRGLNRRPLPDGSTEYVPGKQAGGLAARLKVCPRQVDRYLQVLKHLGVLHIWQGPKDAPPAFKGREYAYAVFQWAGAVPHAVAARLARFWGKPKAKGPLEHVPAEREREKPTQSALELAEQLMRKAGTERAPGQPTDRAPAPGQAKDAAAFFLERYAPWALERPT